MKPLNSRFGHPVCCSDLSEGHTLPLWHASFMEDPELSSFSRFFFFKYEVHKLAKITILNIAVGQYCWQSWRCGSGPQNKMEVYAMGHKRRVDLNELLLFMFSHCRRMKGTHVHCLFCLSKTLEALCLTWMCHSALTCAWINQNIKCAYLLSYLPNKREVDGVLHA